MSEKPKPPGAQEDLGKRVPAIFYRTEAGGEPVRDWLKGLPPEDRKRIGEDIKTVEFGWPVGMPVCKPMGGGVHEVRSHLGQKRTARVLFYIDKDAHDGFASRIRQENPEDARGGFGPGEEQQDQARKRASMSGKRHRKRADHSGSTFDSFLEQEGIREEVEAIAVKRVLAWQLEQAMHEQVKTKQEMARELRTSRSQLDRLLDPRNVSVTLDTITRAARALGKRVIIRVADRKAKRPWAAPDRRAKARRAIVTERGKL